VQIDEVVIAGGNVVDPNEITFLITSSSQNYGPFDARSSDDGLSFSGTGSFFENNVTMSGARNVAGELEANIQFETATFSTNCDYTLR
jgi:hypothetical protein